MKKVVWLLALFIIFLTACGSGNDYVPGELSGQELYQKSCVSCHGESFDRIGRMEPVNQFTAEEIADAIVGGKAGMPAGLVKDEDVGILAKWLAEQ